MSQTKNVCGFVFTQVGDSYSCESGKFTAVVSCNCFTRKKGSSTNGAALCSAVIQNDLGRVVRSVRGTESALFNWAVHNLTELNR